MDNFFADVAKTLKDTAVLDARITDIKREQDESEKRMGVYEMRISNLEKLAAVTENTVGTALESLTRFGKELEKYSINLEKTNVKFVEMEKHVVVLTFKVGLLMAGASAAFWFISKYFGG
jgi:chromosome segregation ATPase